MRVYDLPEIPQCQDGPQPFQLYPLEALDTSSCLFAKAETRISVGDGIPALCDQPNLCRPFETIEKDFSNNLSLNHTWSDGVGGI